MGHQDAPDLQELLICRHSLAWPSYRSWAALCPIAYGGKCWTEWWSCVLHAAFAGESEQGTRDSLWGACIMGLVQRVCGEPVPELQHSWCSPICYGVQCCLTSVAGQWAPLGCTDPNKGPGRGRDFGAWRQYVCPALVTLLLFALVKELSSDLDCSIFHTLWGREHKGMLVRAFPNTSDSQPGWCRKPFKGYHTTY